MGSFFSNGMHQLQSPEGTDRPSEAWPSWSEGQKHALLSHPLGDGLRNILVLHQGLAMLI